MFRQSGNVSKFWYSTKPIIGTDSQYPHFPCIMGSVRSEPGDSLACTVRTDLLLCDRWQTSAQVCTCC